MGRVAWGRHEAWGSKPASAVTLTQEPGSHLPLLVSSSVDEMIPGLRTRDCYEDKRRGKERVKAVVTGRPDAPAPVPRAAFTSVSFTWLPGV